MLTAVVDFTNILK